MATSRPQQPDRPACRARDAGLDVTAGISIHHLTLNEYDVGDYRTFFRFTPPLRSEDDRLAMVQAVADGLIDVIASFHTPQDEESKRLPFEAAAPGAVGLQTLLPAAMRLYHQGGLTLKFNYEFSKALDEISNGGFEPYAPDAGDSAAVANPNSLRAQYGLADYNVKHNTTANAVYDLPAYRRFKAVTGGFQFSADVFHQSGLPYTVPEATLAAILPHVSAFAAEAPVPGLFAAAVPVPDGAPLLDRVVALTGRDPQRAH